MLLLKSYLQYSTNAAVIVAETKTIYFYKLAHFTVVDVNFIETL